MTLDDVSEGQVERRYTVAEAAAILGWAPTTLRDKVTRGSVPHLRLHVRKGVRFTPVHLDQIRADMERPAVLPGQQSSRLAGPDLSAFQGLLSVVRTGQ